MSAGSLPGEVSTTRRSPATFVVRNVANLVPPCESDGGHHGVSAAVEFAVRELEVEHIIVLGHCNCGGIKALLREITDLKPSLRRESDWSRAAERKA